VAKGETELQMVQRHVREGEAHVQRQREIVTEMWERGAPTDIASLAGGAPRHSSPAQGTSGAN
jgi:hypothetical protein